MFFSHLHPLLNKGITFNLSIQASDDDLIAVSVVPHNPKPGANALVPRVFTATAAELDAEFGTLMMGYTAITKTLSEQLEDARLVMEANAAEAAKSAVTPAASKPKTRSATQSPKASSAPAGLLIDEPSEPSDGHDDESGPQESQPIEQTPPASTPQSATLDLGFSL